VAPPWHGRSMPPFPMRLLLTLLLAVLTWAGDAPATPAIEYGPIPLWFCNPPAWEEEERPNDVWFVTANRASIYNAIGFYIGNDVLMERILKDHPENSTIHQGLMTSRARYQVAFDALDRRLAEDPATGAAHRSAVEQIRERMLALTATAALDITAAETAAAVRTANGFGGDPHRFLMAFHPDNNRSPIFEMNQGPVRRIDAANFPKFVADRPVIVIPASWQPTDGIGRHMAVRCADPRGQILFMVMIFRDPGFSEISADIEMRALAAGLAGQQGAERQGFTKVNGKHAAWCFSRGTRISAEAKTYQRSLTVAVPLDGRMYSLVFRADSTLSEENADHRMARLQPLANKILSVMAFNEP
jgi:hypothetical protein